MGHSRVLSDNGEESLKQFYITLNISSFLTDTTSTSDLLDYHSLYGCCIHTQWWPLFYLYSPLTHFSLVWCVGTIVTHRSATSPGS